VKTWIVTHKNLSDEKFYYKVKASSRKAAKEYIATKYNLYPFTLTATASEEAEIFTHMSGYQFIDWHKETL
jgi:hypothetical protein